MHNTLTDQQAMRYNRQILLPGFDLERQEKLLNARVLLVGLGGLGCAAAQYLVASGVGQMTLVDDDEVDSSNLQRQILHSENSVGQSKVESAAAALSKLNSELKLTLLGQRQSDDQLEKLLANTDIALDCSDNLATRNQLNRLCYQSGTPLVTGAAIRMQGQVFCVLPQQQSACYACISQHFSEQSLSCVESGVMSPLVGVIGATQALEAIKILSDFGTVPVNQLQLYDAALSQWQTFAVSAGCVVCCGG